MSGKPKLGYDEVVKKFIMNSEPSGVKKFIMNSEPYGVENFQNFSTILSSNILTISIIIFILIVVLSIFFYLYKDNIKSILAK